MHYMDIKFSCSAYTRSYKSNIYLQYQVIKQKIQLAEGGMCLRSSLEDYFLQVRTSLKDYFLQVRTSLEL
jgi:hypothetical protein